MAFGSKIVSAVAPEPERPMAAPDILYFPGHFATQAQDFHALLLGELDLRPDHLNIAGREIATRRLHDFRADPGKTYHYSGGAHHDLPWTPTLLAIRENIEALIGVEFNACLCNYYQEGSVGMSWHADKEDELGDSPHIASVSLGAERLFRFRRRLPWREAKNYEKWNYQLGDGDLLIMRGQTQRYFEHELPTSAKVAGPRLNLTFRRVI